MKMNKEDIMKLKAVVLYVLSKCEELDFIHLFKIIYFAERSQYATYGQHLVKDSFCALEKGPVPSFLYDAVKMVTSGAPSVLPNVGILADAMKPGSGECYYLVSAKEAPDMEELSEAEVEALDVSYAENIGKDVMTISRDSHDVAWTSAWEKGHNSVMDSLLIAKAGGASDDFLKYIEESEQLNALIEG